MARSFFLLYHANDVSPETVSEVQKQLQAAINGELDIVTVPEAIVVEQVNLESVEAWE